MHTAYIDCGCWMQIEGGILYLPSSAKGIISPGVIYIYIYLFSYKLCIEEYSTYNKIHLIVEFEIKFISPKFRYTVLTVCHWWWSSWNIGIDLLTLIKKGFTKDGA